MFVLHFVLNMYSSVKVLKHMQAYSLYMYVCMFSHAYILSVYFHILKIPVSFRDYILANSNLIIILFRSIFKYIKRFYVLIRLNKKQNEIK